MPNAWTEHLHKWAKENGESYMCALNNPKARASYTPIKEVKKAVREEKRKAKMEGKVGKVVKLDDEAAAKAAFKEELKRIATALKDVVIPRLEKIDDITRKAQDEKWTQKKWSKAIDAVGGDSDIHSKPKDYKEWIEADDHDYNDLVSIVQMEIFNLWSKEDKLAKLYVKMEGFKDINDWTKQKGQTMSELEDLVSKTYMNPLLEKYDIDQFY
jgi:phosphoribosylformylglycinamidine (FGAM) synthase PurS component